jgi:hypothetical protein
MAADGQPGDLFGYSVAFDGTMIAVGSAYHSPNAAYVFIKNGRTWSQQAELVESDSQGPDYFGSVVAISGGTAVVGAYQHTVGSNPAQGAAYVFVQSGTTWSQQAELTASNGVAYDGFGNSLAFEGRTVVVGGPYVGPGAAYVFLRSGGEWNQRAELMAADGEPGDWFGYSVAFDGRKIAVGAMDHTVNSNPDQGAAYVFSRGAKE